MPQHRITNPLVQPKVTVSFGWRLLLLTHLVVLTLVGGVYANEIDEVLHSAEHLFKSMKQRDYRSIWELLSEKSKETIVKEVHKALISGGTEYSKEQIQYDFSIGGMISKTYWDSFLSKFDPDIALEQSKWQMGKIEKNQASVLITYKKSDKPAVLRMFKEKGQWKVGLVETFWPRK